MKKILMMVPDLMFGTKIEDTARRLGWQVESAVPDAGGDFDSLIAESKPRLVLTTFDRTGFAWERLASAAKRANIMTVAFGSHMNVDGFKRARELGCDDILANSKISSQLPDLLDRWLK